mgnify:CR=1 FL=1
MHFPKHDTLKTIDRPLTPRPHKPDTNAILHTELSGLSDFIDPDDREQLARSIDSLYYW